MAINAEASGTPSIYDPVAALAPWRRWPAPSLPLPAGWAVCGAGSAGFVWVYPDRARQLASQLRVAAEELRAARRRLAAVLAPLLIDAPVGFDLAANATDEVAAEALRRVEALEEADRRTAGTFATVGEQLGFPGSLAPPADFNQAELRALERARPRRPRASAHPGDRVRSGLGGDGQLHARGDRPSPPGPGTPQSSFAPTTVSGLRRTGRSASGGRRTWAPTCGSKRKPRRRAGGAPRPGGHRSAVGPRRGRPVACGSPPRRASCFASTVPAASCASPTVPGTRRPSSATGRGASSGSRTPPGG